MASSSLQLRVLRIALQRCRCLSAPLQSMFCFARTDAKGLPLLRHMSTAGTGTRIDSSVSGPRSGGNSGRPVTDSSEVCGPYARTADRSQSPPRLSSSSLALTASDLIRRAPRRRVRTAQLFLEGGLAEGSSAKLLLGRHGATGFFPGRLTGLCASLPEPGDKPEIALVQALSMHGLSLRPEDLERRAVFEFLEADDPGTINEDWLCYAKIQGTPDLHATLDWQPLWVPADSVPYHQMPVDDAIWYPPFLDGKRLGGRFVFDGRRLVSCAVWELSRSEERVLLCDRKLNTECTE
eukprot:TRINITY_DN14597_c0_g1_i1.p1 TRINITY_DN14597_c0_g1~~TRINITY_DN14597_c0_g1_i1.p1  ORF type:complete len:305 (+),score=21.02 TRINITY_DN14597_c0_g1_i1:34-915(+)